MCSSDLIVTIYPHMIASDAATALRQAIANETLNKMADNARELGLDYSSEKREWVGLTDEEHYALADKAGCMSADWIDFARAIEAKLKEKNT